MSTENHFHRTLQNSPAYFEYQGEHHPLNDGEIYVGTLTTPGCYGSYHLILMPGEAEKLNWQEAMEWANERGGELPDRVEGTLLFQTLKPEFKEEAYWTREQGPSDASWAWYQNFYYGNQDYRHKDTALRARAVRRLILQELNPFDSMTTESHYPPLPPESARLGMPMLLEKLHRLTTDADHHRAALYSLRLQLEAIAESWGIPPLKGHPGTSLEVGLSASEAGSVSQLITLMQREHPGMGVDDCIADIFTTGVTTTAHRLAHLIPAETGEEHF